MTALTLVKTPQYQAVNSEIMENNAKPDKTCWLLFKVRMSVRETMS